MNIATKNNLNYKIGELYHVRFGNTILPEINDVHLAIIFPIKKCDTMVFCLPLTSPKLKHFKNKLAYIRRDKKELKYKHTYYIKETDSMVLFEQFRAISINRIESHYKKDGIKVTISSMELGKIIVALSDFFQKNVI